MIVNVTNDVDCTFEKEKLFIYKAVEIADTNTTSILIISLIHKPLDVKQEYLNILMKHAYLYMSMYQLERVFWCTAKVGGVDQPPW